MKFAVQNDLLRVEVDATGAELASVADKRSGEEWIWRGASRLWEGTAPLLFPYCGRLRGETLQVDGQDYPAPIHGFARLMEFACIDKGPDFLAFRLCDSEDTRKYYPYPFELQVRFELFGNALRQEVQVKNPGVAFSLEEDALPFSLGFHPGFALAPGASNFDYKLLFDQPESPDEIFTPGGFMSGERRRRFTNQKMMPLRDNMFADGSICLTGLASDAVTLLNSKTGRAVQVGLSGFDYLLLWGPPRAPFPFLCIEPWQGLPDPETPYGDFTQKPGLLQLAPGETYTTALDLTFF